MQEQEWNVGRGPRPRRRNGAFGERTLQPFKVKQNTHYTQQLNSFCHLILICTLGFDI